MPTLYVRGRRLHLAAVEPGDANALAHWLNDPESQQYTLGGAFPMNTPKEEGFIDRIMQSQTDWFVGVVLAEPLAARAPGEPTLAAGTLVGATGLHQIDWLHRFATFGILVGERAAQDRGLGTEATALVLDHAFDVLNLERVELSVFDHNARGLAVYRKLGFVEEGRRVERCWKAGAWRDEILMVMRRRDWVRRRGEKA
jgi:RimJ/RimL family protein N-acetyltransferase